MSHTDTLSNPVSPHELFSAEELENMATLCHESNRHWCHLMGDHTQVPWTYAPLWQRTSAIEGVEFTIRQLTANVPPLPQASHENWMAQKIADGWVWGPEKNPNLKTHPCLVSYEELPYEQRMKDYLFISIVTAFYKEKMDRVRDSGN